MTPSNPIKLLIVDDHDLVRSGLILAFEFSDDIQVIGEARDGREAFDLCGELQPDVVLMDLMMPGVNGVTATRMITEAYPNISVIAITSFSVENMAEAALTAGAKVVLPKNISTDDIEQTIVDVYGGRNR